MIFILYLSFISTVIIMVLYLVRHYVFSLTALYYQKGQTHYTLHSMSFRPTVSILIPARDEEEVLPNMLQRITELTYPKDKIEVIVIDDGSSDSTGKIAEEFAAIYNYVKVLHKRPNMNSRNKSSALNEGLQHVTNEILICFDADYYPQIDILEKLTAPFIDPEVGAVQGRVTVFNENSSLVSRLVALERIAGYRVDQLARDDLGLIPQYGGTVGGFRRSLIEFLGGWDETVLAEDTDLTFQVFGMGYKVRYVNEAESYEDAVSDLRSYWRQRHRWAKGHMQCFFKHLIPMLKSPNLRFREKFDGVLLLGIYFVPILAALSWFLGALIFFFGPTNWFESAWNILPVFVYSGVGNFALFFEVGVGIYLDKRVRIGWLIPLLLLSFVLSTVICLKAFLDLAYAKVRGRNLNGWEKTLHNGGQPKCM
jgi:cellulose synthase/poly-beta-1,6-N-acetylglucosamine synthase-like glycosyltransferase